MKLTAAVAALALTLTLGGCTQRERGVESTGGAVGEAPAGGVRTPDDTSRSRDTNMGMGTQTESGRTGEVKTEPERDRSLFPETGTGTGSQPSPGTGVNSGTQN